ncbi:Aldehyde dehydrogenase [Colletotrichum sp. SAR 10_98]|nr:Aldehyde dehydrogenase [Colletotrichum sp. SAR 10_98]
MTTKLFQEITTPNGVTYTQPLGLFINNEWVAAKSGEEITVISPIDESQITRVHAGGASDIDVAVKAARAALKGPWAGVSGTDRGKLMLRLADLAEQHTKTLASIDTWNNGKRFSSARGDVDELTDVLRYYAGFADKLHGQGKSPAIIFDDAELEQAVKWCHYGVMANQGQICTATSRILMHESIHNKFVDLFIQEVQKTSKVGDPFSPETFQGPQVNKAQFDRVLAYIAYGKAEGAECKLGGQPYSSATGKGYFVEPTVFTGVKDHMKIYREEIFGPCVAISSLSTEIEAIDRANDSFYGLGAALFTRDITRAHDLAKKIESGTVWINSSNDSDYRIPFGGVKQSGIGRELGEAGIAAYTNIKAVHVNMGNRL